MGEADALPESKDELELGEIREESATIKTEDYLEAPAIERSINDASSDLSSHMDEDDDEMLIRPRSRSKRAHIAQDEEEDPTQAKKARHLVKSEAAVSTSLAPHEEEDEEGNTKVDADGALIGDRTYTSRAFRLPDRGDTYYFLATEIARVSGYRDSYLLFNKNRHLKKLMTTEAEKAFLIENNLIPYSYRNRQIGVVNALTIYKTFGAKVVHKGRKVVDDYFAQRARDQGFTEADFANEEDKPQEERPRIVDPWRVETEADIAQGMNALSAVDYNALLNKQRQERAALLRAHFRRVAGAPS